jgi:hypothetical protein
VNDARFARVGGTQQTFEQKASIQRHGRRTLARNDLLINNDSQVQIIAQYTTVRRALNVLRVSELKVDIADRGEEYGLAALAADLYSTAIVLPPNYVSLAEGSPYVRGFISNMTHRVTPRNGSELDVGSFTFGIRHP